MSAHPLQSHFTRTVLARRLCVALALAACLLYGLALTDDAKAHAILLESIPPDGAALEEAPRTVTLRFNAKLEKSVTSITLTGTRNTRIPVELEPDTGVDLIVIRLPHLSAGIYLVAYTVLARDGHLTEGTLRFTVLPR